MDRTKEKLPFKCASLQIHPLVIPTAWDLIWDLIISHLVLLYIDWDKQDSIEEQEVILFAWSIRLMKGQVGKES